MVLIENRKLADGSELQIAHEVKEHKPKWIKQLPGTKKNYRAKNAVGGIKCIFTQSKEYKARDFSPHGMGWPGWHKKQKALKLRAELVAKLEARR